MWRSSAIVSLLSIVCALVSFVNQLAIAHQFGASISLDAYLIATSVPMFLGGMVGGVFSYSVVPLLVNRRVSDPEGYPRFSGGMLLAFVISASLIALLSVLLSNEIITVLAPQLFVHQRIEVVLTMRLSWLNFAFGTIASYLVAVQNAEKRFLVPLLTSIFPYLGMITFILLFARTIGIMSMVWGMFAGYLFAIPVLYIGVNRVIIPDLTALRLYIRDIRDVFMRIPVVLLSTLCFTTYGTIDAYWASQLGPGNLSYLGYSQRLLITLGNFVVMGPLTVLSPYLSEQAARGDKKIFSFTLSSAIRITILLFTPLALILSILRVSVIEILFQRGSFDEIATQGVASVLPGMLFGMVAMLAVTLILKALHALRDITGAAIVGIIGSVLYFIFSGFLSQRMGLNGIVTAYAFSSWLLLGVSIWRVQRNGYHLFLPFDSLRFIAKISLSLIIAGIFLRLGQVIFIHPVLEIGLFSLAFRICLVSISVLIIYFLSAWLFRIPDILMMISRFTDDISIAN